MWDGGVSYPDDGQGHHGGEGYPPHHRGKHLQVLGLGHIKEGKRTEKY